MLEKVDEIFQEQIFPVLTPLAVGPGRPFPYISNLSLSLAVSLHDPDTGTDAFARVKVPKEVVPRFIAIGENTFVPLEAVIARNLHELFPGMEITAHDYFRVTRDADFTVSDEADDLVRAVEQELRQRRFGEVVRLEVGDTMEPELRRQLVEWLGVEERQVYDIQGMLDLSDLWEIHGIDGYSGAPRSSVHAGDPAGVPARRRRTRSPTCSRRCAPATCSSTTRTSRSRRASSDSSSRRWPTRTSWRSR